jgi:DNA polymerase-3 subunit alpha
MEGTRAQKGHDRDAGFSFGTGDRKKGQTSLFDLISDESEDTDYYPPLPAIEDWSYLHQLDMEKAVLGFYMSGHPLFEYRAMLKYLCTADSSSGKSKSGEMYLVGIVSNISKKKDNRGNPMAFIEMEDLSGKFEVPLFNRDYESYLPLMEVGRVFLVYGVRSQFNGNDDGMLRVMPKAMLPFENLARELRGTLKIRLNQIQVKKGLLLELTRRLKQSSGLVKLQVEAQATMRIIICWKREMGYLSDNSFCKWLTPKVGFRPGICGLRC